MATTINASTSAGLVVTADQTGVIQFQSAGNLVATVNTTNLSATSFVPTSSTAPTNGLYLPTTNTIGLVTNSTEAVRIDSSGNFAVGAATNYGSSKLGVTSSGTPFSSYCSGGSGAPAVVIGKATNDASTSQVLFQFLYNNGSTGLGQINGNGGSQAAFGAYSDIRLKENIVDLSSQLENICKLRPVEFDYKDGRGHQIGFIAQEHKEVYPDSVAVGENDMLTLTGWNKTEAYLVKAIQELAELVKAQAVEIENLKLQIKGA